MSFLLDTNAVSEPGRKRPDPSFSAWFADVPENRLFISAVTLGEMRRGVMLLTDLERRSRLEGLYLMILHRFRDRVLAVDIEVGEAWGALSARLQRTGRIGGMADELLAATALVHDLTLVTRNTRHFEAAGCRVLRPWTQ